MKVLAALFIIAVVSLAFLLNRKLDRKEEKKIAKKSQ
jgi:preprotein translocase subunit SecG